ncbi:MAG: patatin-like phospholipase family protein [Alphaproteobacteria bacterium]|jgi:NTE family protein|nr:patatin-like phospholipase family protein [Alphaproteobacteria bacterium]
MKRLAQRLSRNARTVVIAAALTASLSACASYPENQPIDTVNEKTGYRFNAIEARDNSDSLFVILAFSGGGTRAAALSHGVMEKLRDTKITWEGKSKSLLDEVDVISSVSGGSFTAAYYGLFRDRLFAENDGFLDKFLYKDIQAELLKQLINPLNLARLTSPTFGRIDLVAEYYNESIFEKKTFADLGAKGRPFLMINATNMSKGARFTFTQDQFDVLCSTLDPFQVGRSVAASSNFPIAFTPLQISNWADRCKWPTPKWIKTARKDQAFGKNPRRNNRARLVESYRDQEEHPYIHLLDGGIADNIGFRGPLAALQSNDTPLSLPRMINQGGPEGQPRIRKIVVILVNARNAPSVSYDKKPSPPGLITVLSTVATVPMDNYSFDTVELLQKTFRNWQDDRRHLYKNPRDAYTPCSPPPKNLPAQGLQPLDLYPIVVGFEQIEDGEEYLGHNRDWYLSLPTSFVLERDQVDTIREFAGALLENTDAFKALRKCLE